eukprot:3607179-Amphidinium_carterae.1
MTSASHQPNEALQTAAAPMVCNATAIIVDAEVLARWIHQSWCELVHYVFKEHEALTSTSSTHVIATTTHVIADKHIDITFKHKHTILHFYIEYYKFHCINIT